MKKGKKTSKKRNKYIIAAIIIVITIAFIPIIIYTFDINNRFSFVDKTNSLLVDYKYDINRNYTDFSKHFTDKQIIHVENKSDELKVLSVKWIDVENTLKYKNKFLYEISCEGVKCSSISLSQMPDFDFSLFSNVYLEPGYDQYYTVKFSYIGPKDEKGYFKGKFVVKEEIADKKQYEEFMEQRKAKSEWRERIIKKDSDADNK